MIPDLGVPDSVQALFVLIAFFMPGFIAGKVFDLSFPRPHIPERVRLLEYLTLSFANYGAWSWLVVLVIVGRLWYAAPLAFAASAVVVLFVSPAALAMGMAWAAENRYFQRLAQRFGINAPHHIGTAWEWFFREHQGRRWWVVARLRSGIIIYGFYGWHSYMGNLPDQRDLYLERECGADKEGNFELTEPGGGIYVRYADIEAIAFRPAKEPEPPHTPEQEE